jgi:hypothetical protein
MRALLAEVSVSWIPPEVWKPRAGRDDAFDDVDTPEDLRRLVDRVARLVDPAGEREIATP